MPNTTWQADILAARVAEWAQSRPNDSAYTELRYRGSDCTPVTLTYSQLHHAAGAQAQRLRATTDRGDRVAILCAHGIDYVIAFLACLYGNRIAVPLFPPTGNRNRPRLEAVLADARPTSSLISATDTATGEILGPALGQVLKLTPDTTPADAPVVDAVRAGTAYLQYTSGSTRAPAGVEVTHANLGAALDQLWTAVPAVRAGPIVSWLPFFHDMGLILALSLPLYAGVPGVTMAPTEFVKRPIRWLRALSDYHAGATGSPNFGLTLAVSATTPEDRAGLDLSGLDALLNGAEPIRAEALTDFTEAFAPYGFRHHAHTPGFGLAEGTLSVTVSDQSVEPVAHRFDRTALAQGHARLAPHGIALVGCGVPVGQRIVLVEPDEHTEVAAGTVGEIWVSGPNVCAGYYNDPVATAATFRATLADSDELWLRTGDLGFWYEGHLYVVGRRKDLIVIDGRNHYPADIESTVSDCAPEVRVGHVTAFGHDVGDREDLVVVAELVDPEVTEPMELSRRIRNAIAAAHEVTPGAVVLVAPGRIPKTSSGKLRRGECRALYGAGHLTQP
ncbi:fatty acyl-AMP ligase [Nocardia sp. NPDC052112]|uniref:fatty acyl-AMP ligase n=1 Tax=Nocardia sp. NPDC052112 TaxID=3155646 RepID=UPI0034305DC3